MGRRRKSKIGERDSPTLALRKMGYQFFTPYSSAALKPCMWCKRAVMGGEMCYKHQFYGISSHRCIQLTPTLACNHRCLFCWRSFEHVYPHERDVPPQEIIDKMQILQKKALAGYKVSHRADKGRYQESLDPNQVAISLSGEPTLYRELPKLIEGLTSRGCTTFLVSNGTNPDMLSKCLPSQMYISLIAPDKETYEKVARPLQDSYEDVLLSLFRLGDFGKRHRTAIRVTLVTGLNDHDPASYARIIQDSGADFVEIKGYMHVGYSQHRLTQDHMPPQDAILAFSNQIIEHTDYKIFGVNEASRVICLSKQ
jgi:tRNA wybutosine-synthesizing protein 1